MTAPGPFQTRAQFTCPFCGGEAVVLEPAGVMHKEPACPQFMELGPVEYLHEVNVELLRRN